MSAEHPIPAVPPGDRALHPGLRSQEPSDASSPWSDFQPSPEPSDIWDVFKVDDETAEPEPQHAAFWGVSDEEAII
ncbi:MAG: hypothetical protein A2V70_08525 [Planctomycetes bacterium RBG_13_63_9]|nr:MAG: hypothetical protein A2V70_08525 [Planctomycetes bacterium RBG_13_63_9]